MLLSLIIPVYKVEQYIEECLESVCPQLTPDMPVEVIVINDGTPDDSMKIVDQVLTRYKNIQEKFRIVNKENGGISSVRNLGIALANGEYIAFLDSDDKVTNNYFIKILKVIQNHDIGIIQFSALRFKDDRNNTTFLKDIPYEGAYELNKSICSYIFSEASWFPWLRVYKKSLFKELKFPIGRNYEDAYLIPKVILLNNNIYFLKDVMVLYRENINGITYTYSEKNIDDLQWVLNDMIFNIKYNKSYLASILPLMKYYLNISLYNEGYKKFSKRKKLLKDHLKKEGVVMSVYSDFKSKIFLFSPLIFIFLFNIKSKFF